MTENVPEWWAAANYPKFGDRWAEVSRRLTRRVELTGREVIDIGTGQGTTAICAAQAGAQTTGLDYTPELLETAQERATAAGVSVNWVEADMLDMPFPEASFDVVLSSFGTCYALDAWAMAAELARVCRPGGTIAVTCFTPDSGFGRVREMFKEYTAEPAARAKILQLVPGPAQRPNDTFDWGSPPLVEKFFAGLPVELQYEHDTVPLSWPSLETVAEELSHNTPPMLITRRVLTETGAWEAARRAMLAKLDEVGRTDAAGYHMDMDYLTVLARRR